MNMETTSHHVPTPPGHGPAQRAVALAELAGDAVARGRALQRAWRENAATAAALVCREGVHRESTAAQRRQRTQSVLGCSPPGAVIELVEAAWGRWHRRQEPSQDPLARREPGTLPGRAIYRELVRMYSCAGFRRGKHVHETILRVGSPGASSESGEMWASEAGLPNSYCKKAFRVATSEHRLTADARIFQVPRAERVGSGWLLLTPTLRVRQGRGTSLVVERRNDRGRWV